MERLTGAERIENVKLCYRNNESARSTYRSKCDKSGIMLEKSAQCSMLLNHRLFKHKKKTKGSRLN